MLINLLEKILQDEDLYKKIYKNLNNTEFSYEETKSYSKKFINSLILYLKNSDNFDILKKTSKEFFDHIDISQINFLNIVNGFSIFSSIFLEKYSSLLKDNDLIKFIKSVNIFLIYLANYYIEKLKLFHERILNSISSGILILDNDLNILKTNKKFLEIIGQNENLNVTGNNLKNILNDREGINIDQLKKICVENKKLEETELWIKRNNGKKYHRTINADTLIDENNNHKGFIVYIKDTDYLQYIKETFAKYLSLQVANKILSQKEINLKGERKKVAIMFVDIRNFTEFSEKNRPEYVLKVLNEYFSIIIDIVFEFGGTLDKFIGDGVMVIFGAPIEYSDNIERCINCAIKIQKEIKKLSKNFKVGIGINYGEVIVGNVGSEEKRVEYTAIGDTVNTAQRVEKITPGGKIYITDNTLKNLKQKNNFNLKFSGIHKFKGKSNPIKIYEISY